MQIARNAVTTFLAAAVFACPALGQPLAQPVSQPNSRPDAGAVPEVSTSDADLNFARSLSKAFKNVAAVAEPAVVHITSLNTVRMRRNFFDTRGESRVVQSGLGSGLLVSADGYILTNNHVVQAAEQLKVKMNNGAEFEAKIVGRDELTDLAVIKIDADGLSYLQFGDSDSLEVGEWVVAIGSPFGFSSTVTAGIVSAKGRSITPRETGRNYEDFIQTDAAINPGNSGGPLLNLEGHVIGVNSAIASRTGGYEGIGFAIPATIAKAVMENIILNKRVVRGGLGISLADAPTAEHGQRRPGVRVAAVVDGSPAEKAGIREGDIVLKYRGRAYNEEGILRTAIAITPPGTEVDIELDRSGTPRTIKATLTDQATAAGNTYLPAIGVTFRPANKQMARQIAQETGVRNSQPLEIVETDPDGLARQAGIQAGDIIVGINGETISDLEAVQLSFGEIDLGRGVRLNLVRGGMMGYVDLRD